MKIEVQKQGSKFSQSNDLQMRNYVRLAITWQVYAAKFMQNLVDADASFSFNINKNDSIGLLKQLVINLNPEKIKLNLTNIWHDDDVVLLA